MNDLIQPIDKYSIADMISLDDLMKKYKRERSRKKMLPHYEKMIIEVTELAHPKMIASRFGSDVVAELALGDVKEMVGVYFAVCTLGSAIDQRYAELSEDDLALAAILDEIALAWIVVLTRTFHKQLREQFSEPQLKIGPAYRPGLGKIPIECQATVFKYLPASDIGVTLKRVYGDGAFPLYKLAYPHFAKINCSVKMPK